MTLIGYFCSEGTPKTGLSPVVKIRKIDTGDVVVNNQPMTEIGDGFYKYNFSLYVSGNQYVALGDGGTVLSEEDRYVQAEIDEVDFPQKIDEILDALTFLKDIEGGKWQIINNQMIFFKSDNVTEVARFNLYDKVGSPSEINVVMRTRI